MKEMKLGKALLILDETVFDILDETLQLSDEQLELFISALMSKALPLITCALPMRIDDVIPVPQKRILGYIDVLELLIRDFDTCLIFTQIQRRIYNQSRLGRR